MELIIYDLDTREAEAFFEYAGFRARNMRDPLQRVGNRLLHHVNLTFATEGGWVAHPWPELNPKYAAWKLSQVGERPMLVFTGQLRREAISRRRLRIEASYGHGRLRYTLDRPAYAEYHQDGEGRNKRRPFVVINRELVEEVELVFREWLEELKGLNVSRRGLNLTNPLA